MSYYTSKNPGFILYIALIITSVSTFLFTDANPTLLGILSILWGGYILIRTLTLYEVSEHTAALTTTKTSKQNNHNTSDLSHDLSRHMSNKTNLKSGKKALCAVKKRSIIWLIFGALYGASHLYWNQSTLNIEQASQHISILFMIGAAFWAGQSYAHSTNASQAMMGIFSVLFIISIIKTTSFTPHMLYSHLPYVINNNATFILAMLLCYSAIMLFYSLRSDKNNTGYALTGLSIIGFLSLSYLSHEQSINLNALWISGWALFSVFWIRTYKRTQTKYILYQCQ